MLQKIRLDIEKNKMLVAKDRVVLGVSGGADSVFLLHVMHILSKEYDISLFVVHVNHGIRGKDAEEDALFVKRLCQEYGIEMYLYEDDVPKLAKMWGMSEEEAGRKVRYQHFIEVAKKTGSNKIATAHHQGDQVETVLFHLVRGAKLAGMQGMAPVTQMEGQNVSLIRPMLSISKKDIIDWLQTNAYLWREDITNKDNRYARNKIRNEVVPLLEEINACSAQHIARFAQNAAQWQEYVEQQVKEYWADHIESIQDSNGNTVAYSFNREKLREETEVFAQEIIYQVLVKLAGRKQDITNENVESVCRLMFAQSGKQLSLPYEMIADTSYETLRIRKCLQIEVTQDSSEQPVQYSISLEKQERILCKDDILITSVVDLEQMEAKEKNSFLQEITNSKNIYTKVFDCDTIKNTPCVRLPQAEDYFIINDMGNRKRLSRYFIDCKIPKEERGSMHVVADGNEVLWLIGHRRCNNHKITEKTKRVLVLKWIHKGEENG